MQRVGKGVINDFKKLTFKVRKLLLKGKYFLSIKPHPESQQTKWMLQKVPILPSKAAVEGVWDVKPAKAIPRQSGCTAGGVSQDQGMSVLRRHLQSLQNVLGR